MWAQNSILKHLYMSPVKRICVFEHSVITNFNCACPAIQRGQGSGFLSEGSSWFSACMSEQRRFWRDWRMCRLAWTFAARICDKYQIRLTRSISKRIYIAAKFGFFTQSVLNFKVFQAFIILIFKENKYQHKSFAICKHDMKKQNNKKNCIISILMITDDNFQIRRVFDDNFCQFSIKTYVVGTH